MLRRIKFKRFIIELRHSPSSMSKQRFAANLLVRQDRQILNLKIELADERSTICNVTIKTPRPKKSIIRLVAVVTLMKGKVMDLQTEIAAINAAPISQDQKTAIIAKLILDAYVAPAVGHEDAVQAARKAAQAANLAALRNTGGVSSFIPGNDKGASLAPEVLAKAARYEPTEPVNEDSKGALQWAYVNYVAAGMMLPGAAIQNGPLDRFGSMLPFMGGNAATPSSVWVDAFKAVIANYAQGSLDINKGPTPAELLAQWAAARPRPITHDDNPPIIEG